MREGRTYAIALQDACWCMGKCFCLKAGLHLNAGPQVRSANHEQLINRKYIPEAPPISCGCPQGADVAKHISRPQLYPPASNQMSSRGSEASQGFDGLVPISKPNRTGSHGGSPSQAERGTTTKAVTTLGSSKSLACRLNSLQIGRALWEASCRDMPRKHDVSMKTIVFVGYDIVRGFWVSWYTWSSSLNLVHGACFCSSLNIPSFFWMVLQENQKDNPAFWVGLGPERHFSSSWTLSAF